MVIVLLARRSNTHPPACYSGLEIHLQNAFVCWLPSANEGKREKSLQFTGLQESA